jgi:hypothetical protein
MNYRYISKKAAAVAIERSSERKDRARNKSTNLSSPNRVTQLIPTLNVYQN